MSGVTDNETNAALACEVDGLLDISWGLGIDGVEWNVLELAGSGLLAGGEVDGWALVEGVVVEGDWVVADDGGVGQVGDELGALGQVLGWAWVAGDCWWDGLDEAAADGGVEGVPGASGWPTEVLWGLERKS